MIRRCTIVGLKLRLTSKSSRKKDRPAGSSRCWGQVNLEMRTVDDIVTKARIAFILAETLVRCPERIGRSGSSWLEIPGFE